MIKLETHLHSKGGSKCAHVEPKIITEKYKQAGYGGVVLTNHLCKGYFEAYPGETDEEKIEYFISLYNDFSKECEKVGLKHFFGAEVTALDKDWYISEYLIYGLTPEKLRKAPILFNLTQRELFEFCNKNGLFLAQSHPFRNYIKNGYWEHMHGVEVFNGHGYHINNNDLAQAYAETYGLIKLSGTDFHDEEHTPNAGIYIPETINKEEELVDFLLKGKFDLIKDI